MHPVPADRASEWVCGRFRMRLDRPLVMGIVNVTPDSFSERRDRTDPVEAIEWAERLVAEGADLLDIGGESTRPGAPRVDTSLELDRILPVLEAMRGRGIPISVDTRKPEVMRVALAHGADIINDVGGLTAPGAIEAVAATDCGVCIMHMQGDPATMQDAPQYHDVVVQVSEFLAERRASLEVAGVSRPRMMFDPGIGFGKSLGHNLALLRALPILGKVGPMLVGLSRKSFIGRLTGRDVGERLPGSLAAMLAAVQDGAAVVRVHDVAATRDALKVWHALKAEAWDGA
ncbi:MAG: dihydropteroate synthase [Betaproteobacteria bacterium]|nr:dihydropteroate synthase [Betaproteobacteria bacterium]